MAADNKKEVAEAFVKKTLDCSLFIIATWSDTSQDIFQIPAKEASASARLLLELHKHSTLDRANGEMTGDQAMVYGILYGETDGWERFHIPLRPSQSYLIEGPTIFYSFQITC